MAQAHTTSFILMTPDYFTANLDNGGVRLGFIGGTCFDFPAGHAEFNVVSGLNSAEIEDAFDDFYGRYL